MPSGLFGEGDEDDWMTGSTASKNSPKPPVKKATPSSSSGGGGLFGGLGDEGVDEEGEGEDELFAEPAKKKTADKPKKKV